MYGGKYDIYHQFQSKIDATTYLRSLRFFDSGGRKKGRTAASQHLSAEKAEKMFFPKDVEGGIIPK